LYADSAAQLENKRFLGVKVPAVNFEILVPNGTAVLKAVFVAFHVGSKYFSACIIFVGAPPIPVINSPGPLSLVGLNQ